MLLLNRIKKTDSFSDSEIKIANYVNEYPQDVITMTIHELANATYTSASSVTRFCRKVDTEGFGEFKLQLAKELNSFSLSDKRIEDDLPFNKQDEPEVVAKNILNLNIQSMLDTYNALDLKQLKRISKMIVDASTTHLYGTGQSLILCEDFQYKLLRIMINTNLSSQTGFQFMQATTQSQDSLAIIISYYGMGRMNLEIAKALHAKKVPVVLITGPNTNPICEFANEVIHVPPQEELMKKMASFSSRAAMQLVVDIIYAYVFSYNYDDNKRRLDMD